MESPSIREKCANFTPERIYLLQREAYQIGNRYALLKGEILCRAPIRLFLMPIGGELRMEPIERMVDRETAHSLAFY